jgi:hypothetical protein
MREVVSEQGSVVKFLLVKPCHVEHLEEVLERTPAKVRDGFGNYGYFKRSAFGVGCVGIKQGQDGKGLACR